MADFFESFVSFVNDYIVFPIVNISFVDILDIVVLSVLLYMVYKFIRQRHAMRLALGLALIFIVYVLADWLHMLAISSILKNFYTVGIIAVVVIFQPELRAVLEEVGSTSMNVRNITKKNTNDEQKMLDMINEICSAAFSLSSRGEGALIVLERVGRLNSQMSEGVAMDAKVSKELLCNIFVNKSPLHDGAVIIRDMRIVAASTKSKTISENDDVVFGLGTRHRAGVRISEVSDAVVLIVSEETGTISIANNKLLKRHYDDIGKDGVHNYGDLAADLFKLMTGKEIDEMVKATGKDGQLLEESQISALEAELDSSSERK